MIKKFSIITVTKNNAMGLHNTLSSIATLADISSVEVIVIDGHSTDNTQDIIVQFAELVDIVKADAGNGIYAAMNQGLALANGDWSIFMNAGDRFASATVLEQINDALNGDIVYGKAKLPNGLEKQHNGDLRHAWKGMPFCHQAMFFRTSTLKNRPFNQQFKISADFEYTLWALNTGKDVKKTSVNIAIVDEDGVSMTQLVKGTLESYKICRHYYQSPFMHLFYLKRLRWAYFTEKRKAKAYRKAG